MPTTSGETRSIWVETAEVPKYPQLNENLNVDVCVVGAGIAGMMTAYSLAKAGQRVVVLDDGDIGSGETGRTTAHITAALDDRYYNIESMHGEEGARMAAESHTAAINRAEEICRLENIDCDFLRVDGYLFLAEHHPEKLLEHEAQAAQRAGLTDVAIVERAPLPFWDTEVSLKFPRQAQFHPIKFLAGLAKCIERDGGRIFTGTHVDEVKDGPQPSVTTSNKKTVTARAIVVCTNASISDYVVTHAKQEPYRTFVVGVKIPKGSVPAILLWDTPDPYHYIRIQPNGDHDVLIVGGEDHRTGAKDDGDERLDALVEWTKERFPMAGEVAYRWSGQVMEPVDYMSFTGKTPGGDNVYMHSGDSGNGITHGIMAGILLTDLVLGRPNPWAELYKPTRISLKSAPTLIKHNVEAMLDFANYVLPQEDIEGIQPNEGRVIARHGKRIAAYRDADGQLHERSAICTHLKCIVEWNSTEKSWDCPCHGSRFDPYGKVLNGPAISPLEELD
jgi:glycine/D-amino acid oxidase-like deaminating enzyme/nitrite reductase/ring-hydroxylating ferredoxin subunit